MPLWLRGGFLKRGFQAQLQATKSGTPREGEMLSRILERSLLGLILLLAIALRISLYKVFNGDYFWIHQWLEYIKDHGGFTAFEDSFSDYNLAYLYVLALIRNVPEPMMPIKAVSILFDLVEALFTYLILRLKYPHSCLPILGAVAILFAPTIFINGAAWGQSDAIYTAWCLGSLYFLLSKRRVWACVCFCLAISFKLQAIFFLPVLIVLFLTRKLPFRYLIVIPVIFLAMLAPAWLEGRDAWSLLTIYVRQANEYSWAPLALKAPTFYQWVSTQETGDWVQMGMILATLIVALVSFLAVRSRQPITAEIVLKLALIFAVAIPFFLPYMHERYFYLADVVSIVYAFYFPRYFYVAIIEQLCSCMSVIPSLFAKDPMFNLAYVAFAVLFLIVVTLADLVKTLFPTWMDE